MEKLKNDENFHNFVKLQKEIIESFSAEKNVFTSVLQIEELFRFFNDHFKEFHQKENFRVVLAFVHRCIKVWVCRELYLEDDIGVLLVNLMVEHSGNERDINIVIQIIYQVMNSISFFGSKNVPMSEKLMRELIVTLPLTECRILASNIIACVQKFMEMFPESSKNLGKLWSELRERLDTHLQNGIIKEVEIDILILLFDNFKSLQPNFCDEPLLIATVQHLLRSEQRKFRKCGCYLLKKLYCSFIENLTSVSNKWMSANQNQQIDRSWTTYITILENLEEEQSHLILPSLQNLDELVQNNHLQMSWLNVLFIRVLSHNNNLVLRRSIEFLMKTFSCGDLCEEILIHLLKATNSNSLFNCEGYFLKKEYFTSFLKGDVTILLTLFSQIDNWKSVPMIIWLEHICKMPQLVISLTFEEILKFAACIRRLQNCQIRWNAIEWCHALLKNLIKKMSIKEYVSYVETLYNSGDSYSDHLTFYSKKSSLAEIKEISIFNQRFYEIFTNFEWINDDLLSLLIEIPIEQHGFLKFAPFKMKLNNDEYENISNLYKLDLDSFSNVHELVNNFKRDMLGAPPYDKTELMECTRAAISLYIYQKPSLQNEDEDTLRFIISSGIKHDQILSTFARKLLEHNLNKINLWFIDELLKYKSENITTLVSDYLCKVYNESEVKEYTAIIIEKRNFLTEDAIQKFDILKQLTDELLKRLPSQGDKRIEEAYVNKFLEKDSSLHKIYSSIIYQIKRHPNELFVLDLLRHHASITKKRPRYFENSNEHRVKWRIAVCIYYHFIEVGAVNNALDEIWSILLNENNQLNITYIYEYILGKFEYRAYVVINKLKEAKNLTSSQQVSIISVAYTYFTLHPIAKQHMCTVTQTLLSLSMGANFQTRLFAQMSLYKLLKGKFSGQVCQQIIQPIEDATGDKLEGFLNDVRLNFIAISDHMIYAIQSITNAPFDEMIFCDLISAEVGQQIQRSQQRYISKLRVEQNEEPTIPTTEENDQIQRKMNPINDLTEPNNLIVYPKEEKLAEMFVVASLIDKLPNLGGIARTCEVLGITNLVMDSKMHTEKNDFKNLSMTAEKNLNIIEVKPKRLREFLISKKLEGFDIVGAEQTCKSASFSNFEFPKKCVLLLGHEKDGIPAPLLGLLDKAVEIPQFGQVRSLNVHVTGALFMWEYCKQHLIQK